MIRKYKLSGMSCGGCVNNVRSALLEVPNITDAEVQLNPNQEAIISMNEPVGIDQLQAKLLKVGHYTIKEITQNNQGEKERKESTGGKTSCCN